MAGRFRTTGPRSHLQQRLSRLLGEDEVPVEGKSAAYTDKFSGDQRPPQRHSPIAPGRIRRQNAEFPCTLLLRVRGVVNVTQSHRTALLRGASPTPMLRKLWTSGPGSGQQVTSCPVYRTAGPSPPAKR